MTVSGFLNIDKSAGMTSHDVVARVRRGLGIKKVGHAGTLDPLATGVLVVCIGQATRLSEYAMHAAKRYVAGVHLGVTTDTYDADGKTLESRDASGITRDDVQRAMGAFTGEIDQIPPMYSAIKQGGRKLYELARSGETVERAPRHVTIASLNITDWSPPLFTLEVACSSGTYIRSLAYDLGVALGVGAHLAALRRTASGAFTLETAVSLDTLLADEHWERHVLAPETALAHFPAVTLNPDAVDDVLHGRSMADAAAEEGLLARAYTPDGHFIAILLGAGGRWKPHKVFLPQN